MRYILMINLLLFSCLASAIDIFGTDYYLRDSLVRIVDDERGTSIVLRIDDFFEKDGSDVLDNQKYEELEKVLKTVKRHSSLHLSITGHTDNVYPQAKRYQLSDAYARRIADYLVAGGVDPARIREVSGEGDLWPIAPNDSAERRHLNRRVEITFLRKPPARTVFIEEKEVEEVERRVVKPVKLKKKPETHEEITVTVREAHGQETIKIEEKHGDETIQVKIKEDTHSQSHEPVKIKVKTESHQQTPNKNTSVIVHEKSEINSDKRSGWEVLLDNYILR